MISSTVRTPWVIRMSNYDWILCLSHTGPTHLCQNTDNVSTLEILISVGMLHDIIHTTIYNWVLNVSNNVYADADTMVKNTLETYFCKQWAHIFSENDSFTDDLIIFFSSFSKCKYSKESIYHDTFYSYELHTHTPTPATWTKIDSELNGKETKEEKEIERDMKFWWFG